MLESSPELPKAASVKCKPSYFRSGAASGTQTGSSDEAGTCGELVFYRTGGAGIVYYAGFNCYHDPRSHAWVDPGLPLTFLAPESLRLHLGPELCHHFAIEPAEADSRHAVQTTG